MQGLKKSRVTAIFLALVVVLTSMPGVGLADDDNDNSENDTKDDKPGTNRQTIVPAGARPDLQIEYAGFLPNVEHTITFKVTNVGLAPSTAIKAQIQTLSGGPPTLATPDVPSLAPGQSHVLFYGIGTCTGKVVQATVNDPLDFPSVNDRAEAQVCPTGLPPIVPESPPVIVAVIDEILTPVHLRLGEHKDGGRFPAFEVGPNVVRRNWLRRKNEGLLGCYSDSPFEDISDTNIGFDFYDKIGCELNQVQQLVIDFDLQWLRDIDKKLILRAELLYDEANILGETNTVGRTPTGRITCVGRLGVAWQNWPEVLASTSLLHTDDTDGERLAGGWDVTREVQLAMAPGSDLSALVLHGRNEDLDAEETNRCRSRVENVRLKLQYLVL